MAEAAALKLNLALDLQFFRQQLQKAQNIAASEFTPQVNIRLNRATIDRELNNLQRSLKRRVYRVELQTNLKTEAAYAERIAAVAPALERAAAAFKQLGKGAGKATEDALRQLDAKSKGIAKALMQTGAVGGSSAAAIKGLYEKGVKELNLQAGLKTRPQQAAELAKAFSQMSKEAVDGFIQGFNKEAARGKASGKKLGEGTLEGLAKSLEIASPSKKMKELGKDASDGFVLGLNQGLDDVEKYAQKIKAILDGVAKEIATTGKTIANIQGKRLGLSNLPLMSRSLEGRGERSATAIGGTSSSLVLQTLYPEVKRTISALSLLREQVTVNASKLSSFGLIIGLAALVGVPLAKNIVKLTTSAEDFANLLDRLGTKLEDAVIKAAANLLRAFAGKVLSGSSPAGLLPPAYRGIGPAAGPAGLIGGAPSPAGILPPAYRGIGTTPIAGALPPAYRGLPTSDLSAELKRILREAAYAFVDAIKAQVKTIKVNDLGTTVKAISGTSIAGLLEAGSTGRYSTGSLGRMYGDAFSENKAEMFARRIEQALIRSAERAAGIIGKGGGGGLPGGKPPLALPPAGGSGGYFNAGRRPGGGFVPPGGFPVDEAAAFERKIREIISLPKPPFTGFFKELGSEALFAVKQLVLFGTAYKALAFLQNFPRQVGEAVAQLQSFKNSLSAISPSAQEAATSTSFILDIVSKYNTPLQAAREGFVKLYASMQPAGFSGNQIRGLFEGVSKAAATFGMSADKVDRVNYAFAQMASKGQVMSEELKGQLGDVLPGAMAIFAQAAGFKGPEAIKEFSAQLEAGAYKGKAMVELLNNVSDLMNRKFATGAAGAANTFQGAINKMQNSLKLLYESFEPVAGAFLSVIVKPISAGIESLADGLNAFFTGAATKTTGGFAIAKELEALRPVFEGIRANADGLIAVFGGLAKVALEFGKALLVIVGNPVIGYLARLLLASTPLIATYAALRAVIITLGPALNTASAFMLTFRSQLLLGKGALDAMTMSARAAGIAIRSAFASTGIGLIIVGLSMIIEKLFAMNMELDRTKEKSLNARAAIAAMSVTEARQEQNLRGRALSRLQELQRQQPVTIFGEKKTTLTKADVELFRQAGIAFNDAITPSIDTMMIQANILKQQELQRAAGRRQEDIRFTEQQPVPTYSVPSAGAEGGKKGKAAQPNVLDSSIATIASDAASILGDQIKGQFDSAFAKIELIYGRGAGIFQPFVDAYEKLLQFGQKQQEGVVEMMRLQSQGLKQTISATNREIRNAAKGDMAVYGRPDAMSSQPIAGGQPYRVGDYIGGPGKPSGATGQRIGPSAAEIEAQNAQQMQARRVAIEASLAKEAAAVYNAFKELDATDITSKASKELYDLSKALKDLKRDAEDAFDSLAPESAISDFAQNSRKLQRELEDIDDKFREAQQLMIRSAGSEQIAKLYGSKEFLDSELVKTFVSTLRSLGVEQNEIDILLKAGTLSAEAFKEALDNLIKTLPQLKGNLVSVINEKIRLNNEFNKPIALIQEKAKGIAAFGIPTRAEDLQIKRNELDEQIAKAKIQLDAAEASKKTEEIERQRALVESLKMQKAATMDLIPGIATLGETMSMAFDPALNAFTDFIMGTKSAGEAFRQFAYEVVSGLAKMAAQAAMTAVFKSVLGGISSMFGFADGGVAQGGIQAFANGGIATGGIKFQAFAGGGTVSGPTLGLMGEGKYNEAIVPLPNGRSIPVDMKNNGGGDNFNINVSVDAKGSKVQGDDQRGNQLATAISAAVQEELLKQKRPGGLLA